MLRNRCHLKPGLIAPCLLRPASQPPAFLARRKTKELFRKVFALGKGKKWNLTHSGMFLDFLAGNQEFHCAPWGMPTLAGSPAICSAKAMPRRSRS
jgi:Domain of unknown function (DUF3463)